MTFIPPIPPPTETLDAADRLAEAMTSLAAEFRTLAKKQKRDHQVNNWIIGTIVLHVLLTVAIVIIAVIAANASSNAHQTAKVAKTTAVSNAETAYQACLLSDRTRADDIILWTHVLSVSPNVTAEQKATHASLQAFVDKTFAPALCIKPTAST